MLSFDTGALQSHAASVDAELSPNDAIWQDGDARPSGPLRVTGRLSAAGVGRYYFSGHIAGDAASECRRCLTDVSDRVETDSQVLFAEPGLPEADDASDVFLLDAGARALDLRPAIREEWLLAAPSFTLCAEDCKGICAQCGADLNDGTCACAPSTDPRWDALTRVRPGASS